MKNSNEKTYCVYYAVKGSDGQHEFWCKAVNEDTAREMFHYDYLRGKIEDADEERIVSVLEIH